MLDQIHEIIQTQARLSVHVAGADNISRKKAPREAGLQETKRRFGK